MTRQAASPEPLAVGMDLTFLGARAGGLGRYALELLPALLEVEPATRITAFVGREAPPELLSAPWSGAIDFIRLPLRPAGTWSHRVSQKFVQPFLAARREVDVFHNPATVGPVRIPGRPAVCTLLDLIWLTYPESLCANGRVAARMAQAVELCATRCDRVLTSSTAAVEALSQRLCLPRERMDRAALGVRPPSGVAPLPEAVVRARYELGERAVVLCVAQKLPHKNLGLLFEAMARLDRADVVLVLPGTATAYEVELRRLAASLRLSDRVRFPDWLTEEDLEGFYRAATCVVLPSEMEGFGLPVLEAMIRGVPVACSNAWALPEVAGEAALLFDPASAAEAAAAINRLLSEPNLRVELGRRGRARAAAFTWARTARETLACYRRAIAHYHGNGDAR